MKHGHLILGMIYLSYMAPLQSADGEIEKFNAYINQSISDANIAGMAVAIVSSDSIIFTQGYGYSDIQTKEPFTPNTMINIASISKTFVGVALMHLVENGQVSLDEDVNTFIPFQILNPHLPESIITPRHLMSHSSGIKDDQDVYLPSYHYGGDSPIPLGEFLSDYLSPSGKHYSKKNFTKSKPGVEFVYSNIGAGLAGYIVECVSEMTLNIFTKDVIFKPLGMNNTYWFLSEMDLSKHTRLYESEKKHTQLKNIDLYGLTTYPDGGVRTTVTDLSYYLLCIMNKGVHKETRILNEETVIDMLTPDYIDSYTKFWGIGDQVGHGGGDPGVSTGMYYLPKEKLGIIYFINTSSYRDFKKKEDKIFEFGKQLLQKR
jgi:CubicO group peptidase (beta-lactamase class C family)